MAMNPVVKEFLVKLGIEAGCVLATIVGKRCIDVASEKLQKVRAEREEPIHTNQLTDNN